MKKSIKCFVSYSHKDKKMCEKFLTHIRALSRLHNINIWYDGMIPAGGDIDEQIAKALTESDIVFLLITQDYVSSYYCFEKELQIAMERHNKKECMVVPVILRDFVRGSYPFSKLKYIPTDGKPIDSFQTQNQGFVDACNSIKMLLDSYFKK